MAGTYRRDVNDSAIELLAKRADAVLAHVRRFSDDVDFIERPRLEARLDAGDVEGARELLDGLVFQWGEPGTGAHPQAERVLETLERALADPEVRAEMGIEDLDSFTREMLEFRDYIARVEMRHARMEARRHVRRLTCVRGSAPRRARPRARAGGQRRRAVRSSARSGDSGSDSDGPGDAGHHHRVVGDPQGEVANALATSSRVRVGGAS